MFDDRIEIVSPGGLSSGITEEEYLLKEMCQKGVITVEGKGKGTKYIIS